MRQIPKSENITPILMFVSISTLFVVCYCSEIRENPTRRATYNPAGGGFHRLVENRPDPDAGAG